MELLQELWTTIKETIQKEYELSSIAYKTWILPLELVNVIGQTVYIRIPSEKQQALNYIQNKFTTYFQVIIAELVETEYEIEFILNNKEIPTPVAPPVINNVAYETTNLNPKYTFDTFVVGSYNKLAYSAAQAVAESPGHAYNPLFLYGGPGLGKTHLMHAIGHLILQKNPTANIVYVTSENFTTDVIESIRSGNAAAMTKLREKYRTVDVLMIDDIQFIIGKESTQEEFFHTFNELHYAEKQIILTSDRPPKEMETLDERFRSRFGWGIIVDINAPDYETRVAILRNKCERSNRKVDNSIIEYTATNIKSNIRELEGALNKIFAYSKLNNIPVTQAAAEEALKDIISPNHKKEITPELILRVVCEHYNVNEQVVLSKKKKKDISVIRHVIMYLCRECIEDINLKTIAKLLGKRDHTTVIHGITKVEHDLEFDTKLQDIITVLKKKILV